MGFMNMMADSRVGDSALVHDLSSTSFSWRLFVGSDWGRYLQWSQVTVKESSIGEGVLDPGILCCLDAISRGPGTLIGRFAS